MKRLVLSLMSLSFLLFLLGFAGHIHPMLDAIGAGRWVAFFGAFSFLTFFMLLVGRFAAAAIGLVAVMLAGLFLQIAPDGESGNVRVYSKNLFFENTEFTAVASDIRLAGADIVILQEVSRTNEGILLELKDTLPFQVRCPWQGWNGIAILSRWPLSDSGPICSPERSLMVVKVERPDAPFWAVGVHLQQPWPDVQWEHLERALPVLDEINHGVIVAGDFNTMPWTAAANKIGEITGTRYIPLGQSTFDLWGIGLPLDQVWALGGRVHARPALGSDHLGVLADVWPSQSER